MKSDMVSRLQRMIAPPDTWSRLIPDFNMLYLLRQMPFPWSSWFSVLFPLNTSRCFHNVTLKTFFWFFSVCRNAYVLHDVFIHVPYDVFIHYAFRHKTRVRITRWSALDSINVRYEPGGDCKTVKDTLFFFLCWCLTVLAHSFFAQLPDVLSTCDARCFMLINRML